MLPCIYSSPAVAREIVRDSERRIAQRDILRELPAVASRGLPLRRWLACCIGGRMIRLGRRLSRYGEKEIGGTPRAAHSVLH